jgi:hypothetical protein
MQTFFLNRLVTKTTKTFYRKREKSYSTSKYILLYISQRMKFKTFMSKHNRSSFTEIQEQKRNNSNTHFNQRILQLAWLGRSWTFCFRKLFWIIFGRVQTRIGSRGRIWDVCSERDSVDPKSRHLESEKKSILNLNLHH